MCLSYIPGEAGTETTTGVLEFFTMASTLYPESVGEAQDELDSVVEKKMIHLISLMSMPSSKKSFGGAQERQWACHTHP